MFLRVLLVSVIACLFGGMVTAADPAAPVAAWPPAIARTLPPAAKPLAEEDRKKLQARLDEVTGKQPLNDLIGQPFFDDIVILTDAVNQALRNEEFFNPQKDVETAYALLDLAAKRMTESRSSGPTWQMQRGPVIRGFYSKLDGHPQPYAVVVPEGVDPSTVNTLYVWLHGRGDEACNLQFLGKFLGPTAPGPLLPKDAIVLHPFGRYCNGWKGPGEIDVLEAIDDVCQKYRTIDRNRIVLAGFSMGGAGAWHMGAHYADRWCAVHAGAGFVDVRRYQNITEDKLPPWYEQKLWGLYDVPDYRRNLLNVPVIAYSGELDKQKAAADIMTAELAAEGYQIPHLIGPGMGHKYHPDALAEIHERLAKLTNAVPREIDYFAAIAGQPKKISLQTQTLRYGKIDWIEVLALKKHWEDSRIDGELRDGKLVITTKNIGAFQLRFKNPPSAHGGIEIDGAAVTGFPNFVLTVNDAGQSKWVGTNRATPESLVQKPNQFHKAPGLQGPIDDAFMGPFTIVLPDGKSSHGGVDRWVEFESQHFIERWRRLMRGEPRVVSADQIDDHALRTERSFILWGTPESNSVIHKLQASLPLKWSANELEFGNQKYDASRTVPAMIYPRDAGSSINGGIIAGYVVLNSGLTYREAHDRTNSLQNPKLGDWALIDITEPPSAAAPGKVLSAGFFDEEWHYAPPPKETMK